MEIKREENAGTNVFTKFKIKHIIFDMLKIVTPSHRLQIVQKPSQDFDVNF